MTSCGSWCFSHVNLVCDDFLFLLFLVRNLFTSLQHHPNHQQQQEQQSTPHRLLLTTFFTSLFSFSLNLLLLLMNVWIFILTFIPFESYFIKIRERESFIPIPFIGTTRCFPHLNSDELKSYKIHYLNSRGDPLFLLMFIPSFLYAHLPLPSSYSLSLSLLNTE